MQRIAGLRHVATRHVINRPPTAFLARSVQTRQAPPPKTFYIQSKDAPTTARQRPQQQKEKPEEPAGPPPKQKPIGIVVAATFGVGIGFYTLQLIVAALRANPDPAIRELSHQKDVAARYDETADTFDSEVGFSEWLMGTNKMREKLAKQCRGHVLEVSCGTGRNLGYYDIGQRGKVDSLTFIDLSPQMIDVCKKKWEALQSTYGKRWFGKNEEMKPGLTIRFLSGSALGQMPLAPNGKKYDTIIQTMGFCSTPSPMELLTNMAKYLDTSNPKARILLLEHGRSYTQWLNNILDDSAEKHAEIHGCWYNRDIDALVEDAAKQSGLEVVKERRHHLGTTFIFELKPTEKAIAQATAEPEAEKPKPKKWFGFS